MLSPGNIYHIYNRANGFENLFQEEKNYSFFLKKLKKHVAPVADIFAWCLLSNHFHLMIRIHHEEDIRTLLGKAAIEKFETIERLCSKRFGNFFSSYTQSYNKVYARHGSLFQPNMKHKHVTHQQYFMQLMLYIHNNAAKHGFVKHFYDWPHSSWFQYQTEQVNAPLIEDHLRMITPAIQHEVFLWFGNKEAFMKAHESMPNLNSALE